jgi:hypothetical protein
MVHFLRAKTFFREIFPENKPKLYQLGHFGASVVAEYLGQVPIIPEVKCPHAH